MGSQIIPGRDRRRIPAIHAVTDHAILQRAGFVEQARDLLVRGGTDVALHLRGPQLSVRQLLALYTSLAPVAQASGSLLLINDRVDLAYAVGAPGVHLGGRSLSVIDARRVLGARSVIGASVHRLDEVAAVEEAGGDFVFAGAVYRTASHPGRAPMSSNVLRAIAEKGVLPTIAIGGVCGERLHELRAIGVDGVAAIGAIWGEDDPAAAVIRLRIEWDQSSSFGGREPGA